MPSPPTIRWPPARLPIPSLGRSEREQHSTPPRGLVSLCKTYERSFDTVEVQGSSPPCPRTVHPQNGTQDQSRNFSHASPVEIHKNPLDFLRILVYKVRHWPAQPPKENESCESRRLAFSQLHCCSGHLL